MNLDVHEIDGSSTQLFGEQSARHPYTGICIQVENNGRSHKILEINVVGILQKTKTELCELGRRSKKWMGSWRCSWGLSRGKPNYLRSTFPGGPGDSDDEDLEGEKIHWNFAQRIRTDSCEGTLSKAVGEDELLVGNFIGFNRSSFEDWRDTGPGSATEYWFNMDLQTLGGLGEGRVGLECDTCIPGVDGEFFVDLVSVDDDPSSGTSLVAKIHVFWGPKIWDSRMKRTSCRTTNMN